MGRAAQGVWFAVAGVVTLVLLGCGGVAQSNAGGGSSGGAAAGAGGGGGAATTDRPISDLRTDCPDLRAGDAGPCIALLRHQLELRGAYFFGEQDFGKRTVVRVSQFQRNRGLLADAVVNAATKDALYDLPPAGTDWDLRIECVDLGRGGSGDCPRSLQHLLNQYGAQLEGTGDFGPKTQDAVRSFQAQYGLEQDGDAGPLTKDALYANLPSDGASLDFGIAGQANCDDHGCSIYLSRATTTAAGRFFDKHPLLTDRLARQFVKLACKAVQKQYGPLAKRVCTLIGNLATEVVIARTKEAASAGGCLRLLVTTPAGYATAAVRALDISTDPAHCAA
ncbi:peptidoglycan-binding domain-containing protein [Dactylosporangium sp. CS-047395]|uniref:peptidoglycan-binding domain-containing protein n=1 Tax=Dactylosporangium sp. CS-047395 TaxID=3239936 RepID=UPI003D8CE9C3